MRSSFIADVSHLSLEKVSVQVEFQSFISAQGRKAPSESNVKSLIACLNRSFKLRKSLPKTGPLRFGSENRFPLSFAHEYILVQK